MVRFEAASLKPSSRAARPNQKSAAKHPPNFHQSRRLRTEVLRVYVHLAGVLEERGPAGNEFRRENSESADRQPRINSPRQSTKPSSRKERQF